jgi:flagellar basal body-associated protein FliL
MKYLIAIVLITQAALFARSAVAQVVPFSASAYNFENSPYNFNNSPNNFNATNGVYDNKGNRLAYEVTAPTGVTNFFDNNGNRIGYTPSRR